MPVEPDLVRYKRSRLRIGCRRGGACAFAHCLTPRRTSHSLRCLPDNWRIIPLSLIPGTLQDCPPPSRSKKYPPGPAPVHSIERRAPETLFASEGISILNLIRFWIEPLAFSPSEKRSLTRLGSAETERSALGRIAIVCRRWRTGTPLIVVSCECHPS
jgi:hypothetical protein